MKLIVLATRRRVTIAMFTIGVLLFGAVSLTRLNINLLPDLSYPSLTVRTHYAGAAPAEIENLVTKPIEEVVGVAKHLKEVRSISRAGQSDVVLQFDWGADMDRAGLEVREKLDALELPLEATRPVLLRFDPTLDPIMRFGLFEDRSSASPPGQANLATVGLQSDPQPPAGEDQAILLRRYAEEHLKKDLESSTGVAAVKISGGLADEVQVLVDQAKLAQLGLPLAQIVETLRSENVNLAGGRLEQGIQQYLVRTVNQFRSVDEMGDVVVMSRPGRPVYLRDIATVHLGYKERETITRLNGVEAVEVAIYKEGDANTVAVARAVDIRLKRIESMLPEGMKLVRVYDQSTFIENAVDEVIRAGIIGGLLAIIILYLFLRDFRTTIIISVSIPTSIIATFNLMYGYDLSMNIMSLGGLALGIGLLVDNSIVVLENIARHRAMGKSRLEAAREGAGEVGTAVIASTLTTVAVFFPLVFVTGIAGQLFRDQALTVTFSLLASLIVALTLIPMLASLGGSRSVRFSYEPILSAPARGSLRDRVAGRNGFMRAVLSVSHLLYYIFWSAIRAVTISLGYVSRFAVLVAHFIARFFQILFKPFVASFQRLNDALGRLYPRTLTWSLAHRTPVLAIAMALFAGSMFLVPRLGVELIPQMTQGEFDLDFRLPPGTPLERTDAVLAQMQRTARDSPDIAESFAVSGTGNRMDANPEEGGENWGQIHIALTPEAGPSGEARVLGALREAAFQVPGVQYKFERPALFSFETPIEVQIAGFDLDGLKQVSRRVQSAMESSGRFADVKSTMEQGHPEVQIIFDRERAAALGLAVHDIADRVVGKVRGEVATRYSWRDRKIDVLVRARAEDRTSIEQIRRLIINPESERPVPLEAVALVREELGPSQIRRVGQQRVGLVTANLAHGDLGTASAALDSMIQRVSLPAGISVRQGGQSEEMAGSFRSLLLALALAVFLVYLVMASQFESLLHPLVIFFSIPLAAIGAVLALWITGSTLSVVVFIGLILLAGIVVNNAIVLIDLVNTLRGQGMPKRTALIEAGRLRLRPILMTTLTTTLGLLPLAIGLGDGAEIRAPMAITVIGGLLVSTLLTLVVIPVMYDLMDRTPDAASAP